MHIKYVISQLNTIYNISYRIKKLNYVLFKSNIMIIFNLNTYVIEC